MRVTFKQVLTVAALNVVKVSDNPFHDLHRGVSNITSGSMGVMSNPLVFANMVRDTLGGIAPDTFIRAMRENVDVTVRSLIDEGVSIRKMGEAWVIVRPNVVEGECEAVS